MSEAIYNVSLDRVANQPVSEGIHSFIVSEITEGESSKNNPMWTVRLKCLDAGPDEGKEATLWLVLTESARWKLEKFFDAVGAPTSGNVTYQQFLNRRLKAQITHRMNDGRINADVGEMFPISAKPSAPTTTQVTRPAPVASSKPVTRTGAPATTTVPAKGRPQVKAASLPADATEGDIPFETA